MDKAIHVFYKEYHDQILAKRHHSPFWLRHYAHHAIHSGFLKYIPPGQSVLDAGCGEGTLSLLMARQGAVVTGVDMSWPNVSTAQRLAQGKGVRFLVANAENLPFRDGSFDVVVSSHVLEHLPDLHQGLRELHRTARKMVLIAMPTCLNPAAWTLLGKDVYWKVTRRTPFAIPLGILRMLIAFTVRHEGPNEGYAGEAELPHVWRFPWMLRRQIESVGLKIIRWEAGPLLIPYLAEYFPLFRKVQAWLDRWGAKPVLRYLGYGSLVICQK